MPDLPPDPETSRERLGAKLVAEATTEELIAALCDRCIGVLVAAALPTTPGNWTTVLTVGGQPVMATWLMTAMQMRIQGIVFGQCANPVLRQHQFDEDKPKETP